MAKKVTGVVKLQLPAGKATPAPPVGPALGGFGINIMQFVKEYNEKTSAQAGAGSGWIFSLTGPSHRSTGGLSSRRDMTWRRARRGGSCRKC